MPKKKGRFIAEIEKLNRKIRSSREAETKFVGAFENVEWMRIYGRECFITLICCSADR